MYINLSLEKRRRVTLCNHNFSHEAILHPNRIMDEYDLLYMQDGEWEIIEDDIHYLLSPGCLLLLEPGKHHYSEKKCSPMMRNIYVHFSSEEKDGITTNESQAELDEGVLGKDAFISVPKFFDASNHPEIRHGLERIVDAFWSRDVDTRELRSSLYLETLLLQLSDLGSSANRNADVLISEIIHRFHCEPERFLSPQELADSYHISVRSLSGRFKKETGMSIHQYQLHTKLEMAYDLLPIAPERSLHDIALSYGFYDEFQFSKLFKRQFGIVPSQRR